MTSMSDRWIGCRREIAETSEREDVSMTIEPPSMKPSCTAASDTTGIIA